ncbi:Trans-2,3-dihydro-3-hydroxyanthranilate isomerase [Roseovarius albus]|uniref:Trans-2,3-dihydro-3-hydroxyanthranilate isomerase n=1 Tax=Roseovarius albus TaxID=1247867 RepID=A0A1X6YMT1_9RHOB|nr:PhzF family phenazine biosynthesis protein [Roseovarius albus]SLN26045.1 Trans-2,3-dihydro-3-hydroxyanthranilate isomerase [Roseovarius albus]
MNIQKLASFTQDTNGGNPAGVVIGDVLPEAAIMQKVAADVGYSETVFAAPESNGFRARYFAPQQEVPFCGHATIALGAALGQAFGAKEYDLTLNDASISVTAYQEGSAWGAKLVSPPTRHQPVEEVALGAFLDLFGLEYNDLDPDIAPALVHGGADHLLLPLARHDLLKEMSYDFDAGAALMQKHKLVTINLIWRKSAEQIHSRNPFAGHGVYEDPATGAAAAALAGYLRDAGYQGTAFEVIQGVEMGRPSRLHVKPRAGLGAPVEISGLTAPIT